MVSWLAQVPDAEIVEEGLSVGEWIATAGVHSLEEGQTVRILPDEEA